MMKPLLLTLPALTPKGSSFVLDAAHDGADEESMLCTSTEPVSLDEGLLAAAATPPPLLLLDLMRGYGPCALHPIRGSVKTSAPLLAFLAATALSAATSSSRVS
jgi:hypothetical protein